MRIWSTIFSSSSMSNLNVSLSSLMRGSPNWTCIFLYLSMEREDFMVELAARNYKSLFQRRRIQRRMRLSIKVGGSLLYDDNGPAIAYLNGCCLPSGR